MTMELKGMMALQVKEALAEENFVVEPENCSAVVMMRWEVETQPGHVALTHLMQQAAAGAADIVAAVVFPLPTEQHRLVAVNQWHDQDLEDEDC